MKAIELLSTLTPYQLNRFGNFLRSPYFNQDDALCKCFGALSTAIKRQLEIPDKKEVWKYVHGNAPFSNIKFARLYSDLAKKAEEFLAHDRLKHSPDALAQTTLDLYNEHGLVRYFPERWKQANANLHAQPQRDVDFYLKQFELEAAYNTYTELKNKRSTEKNILQTLSALDKYYFANKLSYLAALLHYKKFLSAEGDVALATEILKQAHLPEYQNVPIIAVNYRVVLSLMEQDKEEHFFELKKLLQQHAGIFKKNTARNFYAFAINFCIRRINYGEVNFVRELFALYKEMLQNGLLADEKGKLSQFDYKNIVTVALRAGEALWADKFIKQYKNSLPQKDRQNAYTFNLARLYFYQKKYDKVLPLLQDVEYSDIFYQLDSKTTLVKTYYELGEYIPLMALKESFRILLRRKKIISEQNRVNYMNFLRFTMKLYRADVKDRKKIATLQKQIAEATNVADKSWLVEKVSEISGI